MFVLQCTGFGSAVIFYAEGLNLNMLILLWLHVLRSVVKATEVAVADLLWVHWGHRTKVQMRNILQNDRKTRGKKVCIRKDVAECVLYSTFQPL